MIVSTMNDLIINLPIMSQRSARLQWLQYIRSPRLCMYVYMYAACVLVHVYVHCMCVGVCSDMNGLL